MNQAYDTAEWHPEMDEAALDEQVSRLLASQKLIKTMSCHTKLALQSVARLNPTFTCPPEHRGLIVCQGGDQIQYTEVLPQFTGTTDTPHSYAKAARRTPPLWLLQQLPNMTAAHLAREWQLRGPSHSFSQWQLPVDQGHLTARMLFEAGEAEEILEVTLDISATSIKATARHLYD